MIVSRGESVPREVHNTTLVGWKRRRVGGQDTRWLDEQNVADDH